MNIPEGYDWFVHGFSATVASWGAGRGATATATPPALPGTPIVTGAGRSVRLWAIMPLNAAAGALTILKGDGVTSYFGTATFPTPGNLNGCGQPLNIELLDGLSILGGTGGSFLIIYRVAK